MKARCFILTCFLFLLPNCVNAQRAYQTGNTEDSNISDDNPGQEEPKWISIFLKNGDVRKFSVADIDSINFSEGELSAVELIDVWLVKDGLKMGKEPGYDDFVVMNRHVDGSQTINSSYTIEYTPTVASKQQQDVQIWTFFQEQTVPVTVKSGELSKTIDVTIKNELVETGLPVIYIETEDRRRLSSGNKNYTNAHILITDGGSTVFNSDEQVKVRGNATASYPKKPIKIKLKEKTNILGMGNEKDWVLLANFTDKSMLRTGIGFYISRLMEFQWTPKDRFVDVVLNGDYYGTYTLTESIEQNKDRVNIPERGFLIERDNLYYTNEPVHFTTNRGLHYTFKNPDTDTLQTNEIDYIHNHMNELETVLDSESFKNPDTGFRKYIDVESFARWILFQELIANIEPNVYLTKNDMSAESKLFMGPVWDMEWSMGIGWYDGAKPRNPDYWVWRTSPRGNEFYYDRILQDADFAVEIKTLWNKYKPALQTVFNYIESVRQQINSSQELNFRRWDILDRQVSVEGIPLGTFDAEVNCTALFLQNRIQWLDNALEELPLGN